MSWKAAIKQSSTKFEQALRDREFRRLADTRPTSTTKSHGLAEDVIPMSDNFSSDHRDTHTPSNSSEERPSRNSDELSAFPLMDIDTHSPSYSPPTSSSGPSELSEIGVDELEKLRLAALSPKSRPSPPKRLRLLFKKGPEPEWKVPKWPGENQTKCEHVTRFKRSSSGTLWVHTDEVEDGRKVFIRADGRDGRRWLGPGRKSISIPSDDGDEDEEYEENPVLTELWDEFWREESERRCQRRC